MCSYCRSRFLLNPAGMVPPLSIGRRPGAGSQVSGQAATVGVGVPHTLRSGVGSALGGGAALGAGCGTIDQGPKFR